MTTIFVSLGVTLCLFGLFGLLVVISIGVLVRKNSKHYSEDTKKATLERLIIVNYLALTTATFGLILTLVGILLG